MEKKKIDNLVCPKCGSSEFARQASYYDNVKLYMEDDCLTDEFIGTGDFHENLNSIYYCNGCDESYDDGEGLILESEYLRKKKLTLIDAEISK